MRRLIGILGLALPIIAIVWTLINNCNGLFESISAYYHSAMRDVFVGILCAVSLFLFSYHGYGIIDFVIYKIIGISALGIALSPAQIIFTKNICLNYVDPGKFSNTIHVISAALFFLLLSFVSFFLFTKTYSDDKKILITQKKKQRNLVYRICGAIIFLSLILLGILGMTSRESEIFKIDPIFWLETIALFAFSISWLIKGEVMLKDVVND